MKTLQNRFAVTLMSRVFEVSKSGRGSQYCAQGYRRLLQPFHMQCSMSRKGNGYDNAPMESFWGTLKK